jgi:hypothetical protein
MRIYAPVHITNAPTHTSEHVRILRHTGVRLRALLLLALSAGDAGGVGDVT